MKRKLVGVLAAMCMVTGLVFSPVSTMSVAAEELAADEDTITAGDGSIENEDSQKGENGEKESADVKVDAGETERSDKTEKNVTSGEKGAEQEKKASAAPQLLSDGTAGTEENPWDISAEGEENNVKAYIKSNSEAPQSDTYTLVLTGSGAMQDYETKDTPWYDKRESITAVELPDGLTHIGKSAFLQTGITKVTIPDTVTSIGQNAFWNCNTIETEIPASVTELGETAFFGIFKVTVAEDNPNYSAAGNILYDKEKTKMIQASQDMKGTLAIPDTVEEIGAYALYNCKDVTGELDIPDSVRTIGHAAFYGTGITSLKLGANVQSIGESAFQGCTELTGELEIPDSVVSIEAFAFSQLNEESKNKLTSITLGAGMKSVGENAFYGSSGVKKLSLNEGLETIGSRAFSGLSGLEGDLNIPSTVKEIGEYAFYECVKLNGTLTIGGALTSIAWNYFGTGGTENATDGFEKVILREGVQTIGENCFIRWNGLKEAVIPDTVTTIENAAFNYCESLTKVSFGAGVKYIGNSAFNKTALAGELKLPASLETIGNSAFAYCDEITEVNIPDTVTSIGYAAFSFNTKTEKITVPYGDIQYGGAAGEHYIFTKYGGEDSKLTTVVLGGIPENVSVAELFSGSLSNVQYVILGSGVGATGDWFLSDVDSLEGGLYPSTIDKGTGEKLTAKATKFTLAEQTELSYGDTLQMMSFEKPASGEDVTEKITYSSSNDKAASVDENGKITATGVADEPVVISASYEGCKFAELELSVKPRVLTYADKAGQLNPGSVIYPVSEEYQDVNDLLSFKWDGSEGTEVTLKEGTDIDYTYTVPVENGGSGIEATVDFLPVPVGEYTVWFHLKNTNYVFKNSSGGEPLSSLKITVKVLDNGMSRGYLAEVTGTETNFTYDGKGKMPADGTLIAYEENSRESAVVDIGSFTVQMEGLNDTTFHSKVQNIESGTKLSEIDGLELPVEPGTYVMTVSAENGSYYLYKSQVFTIGKAAVTIRPNDKAACVGSDVPTLESEDYTISGLAEGDELAKEPILAYEQEPDMSQEGEFAITADGAEANEEYYTLTYEKGTLRVHEAVHMQAKEPTCTEEGNVECWYCEGCGKYFSDSTLSKEISAEDAVLAKTEHTFEWVIDKKATETETGLRHEECKVCGYAKEAVEIPALGKEEQKKPEVNPPKSDDDKKAGAVKTGDDSVLLLWIALLLGGAAIGSVTVYTRKKKR